MAVTAMARETDTDKRLDDLNARVESIDRRMETGFAEVRAEFKALREEMQAGFKEAQAESVSIRRDMANQFAAQNRMMIQLFGGMFVTTFIGFLGVIAALVTQT